MSFDAQLLDFHFSFKTNIKLPENISWIRPYDDIETQNSMRAFFKKFYHGKQKRVFLFGINPGRFGAGVTGIPFTDPVLLETKCGIQNNFDKKQELSARFVYEFIDEMGGPSEFYKSFYITSVLPLGLLKNDKNYNYYDDAETEKATTPLAIRNITEQTKIFGRTETAFSMGQGKNFKFLLKLNKEHQWFKEIVPLPHPRWVMQYRLKRKEEFIEEYVVKLNNSRK